jgi:hypothetical protein
MSTEDTPHTGAVALSDLLDGALRTLEARQAEPSTPPADGFLYSGNRHESVPRKLFLDRRLTPLERNAWQVFRLMLTGDGLTAFPTYDQLRPWLASMPCGAQASHETVARALTLLRLTRWLSLVRRRRDPKTGRILGNLYVLHDVPLSPFEAMQLVADYLNLVCQALSLSAKAVQVVGVQTLKEIAEDPLLSGRSLPTRLQVIAQRMSYGGWSMESYPQAGFNHDSEEGGDTRLRNVEAQSSDSEAGRKPASNNSLRIPKPGRTVRNESINEVRTVPRVRAPNGLVLPERFTRLKEEQQAGAMVALKQVDESMRQAVLDEWVARCDGSSIRNPAGYLFGIIQRAIRGEFNAWAGERQSAQPTPSPRPPAKPHGPPPKPPVPPEVARQHIAHLRELMSKR